MQSAAHQEKHFQQYIIDRLVEQGWKLGDSKFYDTERAVYPKTWKAGSKPAASRKNGTSWNGSTGPKPLKC